MQWHPGRWLHPGRNDCVGEEPCPQGGVGAAQRGWRWRDGGRVSPLELTQVSPPTEDPRTPQGTGEPRS